VGVFKKLLTDNENGDVWYGDEGLTCEHEPHEDCMNCDVCGNCKEDLDSENICIDCGGDPEDDE